TTQASLTLHTTELAGLRQATDTIAHSLQALLERLPSPPTAAPAPSPPAEATSVPPFKASTVSHTNIPRPALPDAYDGDRAAGERFLQSCITYIQLSGEAFTSDVLKIAWILSYMKTGRASTYVLRVFHCPGGVNSFDDWEAFEKDF
ncbi:hypothetical protein C0993_003863, partial [Termitomyces sp. T159_Od127]